MRQKTHITNNYKTKKCRQFFENGYCAYGNRCQFLHKYCGDGITVSYTKIMQELVELASKEEELCDENFLAVRPRLKTFDNIVQCEEKDSISLIQRILKEIKTEKIEDFVKDRSYSA